MNNKFHSVGKGLTGRSPRRQTSNPRW